MLRAYLALTVVILGVAGAVGVLLAALERAPGLRGAKDAGGHRVPPRTYEAVLLVLGPTLAVAEALHGEWGHSIMGAALFVFGFGAFVRGGAARYRYAFAAYAMILVAWAIPVARHLVPRAVQR